MTQPDSIASLTRSPGYDSDVQKESRTMSLNQSSSRADLRAAFEHDLESQHQPRELMSAMDVEEYVDTYSHPETLSGMQQLAREVCDQASSRKQISSRIPQCDVQSDPEIEPEEWALTIIATLNSTSRQKPIKQARL